MRGRGQGWHIEKTHLKKPGFFQVGFLGFFKCNLEKTQKFGFFQDFFDVFGFFQDFLTFSVFFKIFLTLLAFLNCFLF